MAYHRMMKLKVQSLHQFERPVSLLASMMANQNRDPKKKKTPFAMDDFYLYQPTTDKNLPAGRYGAAALDLVDKKMFPTWALFCFKDLAANSNAPVPSVVAYIGEDFLVLAPVKKGNVVKGLLIARESATGRSRRAVTPTGEEIYLNIPKISTKIIAEEDCELEIA